MPVDAPLPAGVAKRIRAARRAEADARQALDAAAGQLRAIARDLDGAGFSGRRIATALKVSPQRVSQLLSGQ